MPNNSKLYDSTSVLQYGLLQRESMTPEIPGNMKNLKIEVFPYDCSRDATFINFTLPKLVLNVKI